ncbi:MAG: DUF1653 domain-containing protein [Burkholderiaceae bacterium]|nr:DUF1653 domain-containing protein [Burkholderiaceae bacterium]
MSLGSQTKNKKSKSTASPQRFRHYKGGIYELVCEATQESDLSSVIVYRSHNGSIWTRPKSVFFEMVEVEGVQVPRFAAFDE